MKKLSKAYFVVGVCVWSEEWHVLKLVTFGRVKAIDRMMC